MLAHPVWTGIAGLVGIAALLVVLYADDDSGSPASQEARETTPTITVSESSPSTTVTSEGAQGALARDPESGETLVGTESSGEFFDGRLVVSISDTEYRDPGLVITRLVLRVRPPVVECAFEKVPNGEAIGAVAGDRLYWVEIRGLDLFGAYIAAFSQPTSATSESEGLERRCVDVMTP